MRICYYMEPKVYPLETFLESSLLMIKERAMRHRLSLKLKLAEI